MKKIISALSLLAVIIIMFTACSSNQTSIEDYEWKLRTAMNMNQEGLVVAVGEKNTAYPDAEVVDVFLTAKDGVLVIEDKTNGVTYEGAYEEMYITDSNQDYKIIIKGKDGYANASETTSADGKSEPTLPIAIGGYDLYFYASATE